MQEDADLLWAPRPGFRGEACHCGTDVRINSLGFRDREYSVQKPPGVFRILCLGDSTTFGHWLPVEKTYSKVLEELLNRIWKSSGMRFEVINAGDRLLLGPVRGHV